MKLNDIEAVIRKSDYTLKEKEIKEKTEKIQQQISSGVDFSKFTVSTLTQGKKKRKIYQYSDDSIEKFMCSYLSRELAIYFKVKYANRNKMLIELFDKLKVINDLNDFVIVRCDFKSFFDSVPTNFIFQNYIESSNINRENKKYIEDFSNTLDYCRAGISLCNILTELPCREFDKKLTAIMKNFGIIFYGRYVDDFLIITNKYISEDKVKEVINGVIKEAFKDCEKVMLNDTKFVYISRRNLSLEQQSVKYFDFLGYKISISNDNSEKKRKIDIKYGITTDKMDKYKRQFNKLIKEYQKNGNLELLRQRTKFYACRIVTHLNSSNSKPIWIARGIVSNYSELTNYINYLDLDTESFFKKCINDIYKRNNVKAYFIQNNTDYNAYNLYANFANKRSIIFDPKIGVKEKTLRNWIYKIDGEEYKPASYREVMFHYLNEMKIGKQ